jgi:hypothetical protein
MIYAVNMTCSRDAELEELMAKTLEKYCPECKVLLSLNTDDTHYANGAGWEASMMKLEAIRQLLSENEITDKDFVLSVDSDVVFCSPQVFKYADPQYGIIGIKHNLLYPTFFGEWSHMSGALIFIRGDIAKKICALSVDELNNIRFNHFKPFDMTENEDVVLSYLASYVGAQQFALPGHLSSGDFEGDVIGTYRIGSLSKGQIMGDMITHRIKSFYHLNYCPTQFMGEPVDGKWRIPGVLKIKNIEL